MNASLVISAAAAQRLLPLCNATPPPPPPMVSSKQNAIIWFRKGLRIHDNPALDYARRASAHLYPVFVLDPHFLEPDSAAFSPGSPRAGVNRIQFLLESLADLDSSLNRLGSRLLVFKGNQADVMIRLLKEWNIGKLCFEFDTDPYSLVRDKQVKDYASASGIEVFSPVSHTLFNPLDIIEKNGGKPPLTYRAFVKLAGQPSAPLAETFSCLPRVGNIGDCEVLSVPTIKELGYGDINQEEFSPFRGGETIALKRLEESLENKDWVANFEKPKGDPSAFLNPATTVLSPYLKFGCLSSRYFYHCINEVSRSVKKHSLPPVSLAGQIPWHEDEELLVAWREARTGYPWIDAIMVQVVSVSIKGLIEMHTVCILEANHPPIFSLCLFIRYWLLTTIHSQSGCSVFIHWERGRDVFERLLIDSDWAINNGNWLWLSCSSFFYQYNRIYSPSTFGQKYDPDGNYIRHFLPVLKADMPKDYIYEPWTAPLATQKKANCIIGKDYPKPVVDHEFASKECRRKMGAAYALNQRMHGLVSVEDLNSLRRKLEEEKSNTSQLRNQKRRR
ncbi:(6-4)DNA photolyase [Asimina triloba]